ncbi:transcriptional regulator TACO1-like protein, partial [Microdochium trichocladiopsis]
RQHARTFATTPSMASGHNRWSKIRHEKGAADMKKTAQRNVFAKHLTLYSKLYGGDPALNSQLASVIAAAKKAGMPKANIDAAVARGQGKSTTGEKLEAATFEVIVSGPTAASSVAIVVDIESDNKTRSIKDLRVVAKKHKALAAPTAFQFTRTGRIVLGPPAESEQPAEEDRFDDVLMAAVEAGAEDVEQDDEGNFLLWTQPGSTHHVAQTVAKELGLQILESDIIYKPTAEMVAVDDEAAAQALAAFLAAVKEYPDVQAIYSNAIKGAISEEAWAKIDESLD